MKALIFKRWFPLALSLLLSVQALYSQGTLYYRQFWNEFAFTRPLSQKWSLELNLGQTWTGSQTNKSMFSYNSQLYPRLWGHYWLNDRWKLSAFYAWFYNKYVPEIDQREYPEGRLGLQAIYYIKKSKLTLSTRMRFEDRHIMDEAGTYEGVYRFRDQIKMVYVFNKPAIIKGAAYSITSEELFFKTFSKLTGSQFFDRNRFTIGGGYSVTDDLQIEVTYANEFLPRTDANESYNALQVNVAFNNFFININKKIIQPIFR